MSFSRYEVIIPLDNYSGLESTNQNTNDLVSEIIKSQKHLPIVTFGNAQYLPIVTYMPGYIPLSNEVLTPVPALKFSFGIMSIMPKHREQYNNAANDLLREGIYHFSRHTQAAIVQNEIFYFLCLTQIAYPFSIQTFKGEIHVDGEFYLPVSKFQNPFKFWFDEDPKRLAIFRKVSLQRVYSWVSKREITFNRKSDSNIEKLLFALTHTYYAGDDEQNILFWTMFGLEAFYCTSNQNVTDQLRERIKLFLGDPKKFTKKMINEMYAYRSDFIHGTTNILPAGFDEDFINLYSSREDKQVNIHLRTSISILLCSLQKIIASDLEVVSFETIHTVSEKSKSGWS